MGEDLLHKCPIVAITAYDSQQSKEACERAGIDEISNQISRFFSFSLVYKPTSKKKIQEIFEQFAIK
jgi:CheY-like chemotaxis protein